MSDSGSSLTPSPGAPSPLESAPPPRWRVWAARAVELLLLAALCAVAVTQQVHWAHTYHEAPIADSALHIANANAFGAVMDAPTSLANKLLCAWAWPDLYGSGVYLISYIVRPFTGSSVTGLLDSLSPFLCFAIIGAWLLGRACGGPAVGVTAAALVIADPRFIHASRCYWLDLPVTGMILLTLAVLVESEGFRKTGRGVLAGVLLGLSLLVKYTAIWFLAVPFMAAFAWGLWRERPSRVAFARFSLAAALAGLALTWLMGVSLRHQLFVIESGTLVPPLSFQLVFGCAALALAWGTFAWYLLDGVLATGTWAAACVVLIAAPWAVVNRYVLGTRWSAIMLESPDTAAHWREHLLELFVPLPTWVLVGAALSVLVTCASPRKRSVLLPVVLAVMGGAVVTLIVLGSAYRYLTPVTALLSVLAVGWVPNIAWVAALVCVLTLLVTVPIPFGGPQGQGDLSVALTQRFPHAAVLYTHVGGPDREALADTLWRAAAGARGIAVVSLAPSNEARDDLDAIYYLLVAAANRSGAPCAIELFTSDGGEGSLQVRDLMPFQPTRARTLATWRGANVPLHWRASGVAPEVLVLFRTVADPVETSRQLFSRTYTPVPVEVDDVVMLRLPAATSPR